ncbi:MAG TPA: hypothetical protein VNZ22_02220, partial [Bacillota bacterium]|nr:hypothetical protein [Bacillota bacterium]
PRQGELKDKVQDLQQKAAKPSPSAAQSMGEATRQMQKSQASLAGGKNNPEAQQAAMDALQQADQQLSQDIAQLEEAQQELAKLEEMQRKLAGIIDKQQKVQFGTAKQASQAPPAATPELSQRQEKLGSETGQLQTETSTPAPAAAEHLGKAQEHMGQAKSELDKPAPKTAIPKQSEALTDLYAAQHEMDNRMNELREQLGLGKQDNAQSLADAAARIEQAQRAVDQALTELQQAPPGLVDALTQQQQHIADTLGDMAKEPGTPEGVSQAQQSAAKAAQELGQSNLREALKAMKAAEAALKPNATQPAPAGKENGKPTLPQVNAQQEEVRTATEQLLATLQGASESAMKEAESALESAGQAISPLTSGQMGPLPRSVRGALQNAQENLAGGAAQAAARQGVPAQSEAVQASQSLAQAQAALALAQAGLGSESMMAQGNTPSSQSQNQGQAQGQQAQAGAQGSGKGNATPQGTGRKGNWDARGNAEGPRNSRYGPGQYTRLPARDRAAILQSQSEKYPQEYGSLVEQYLKNLSDESATEP